MQNQQQMAAMVNMNANAGPIDGTPVMGNGQRRPGLHMDPRDQLNTYIYDYFLRNNHTRLARMMMECDLKMSLNPPPKSSPNSRTVNGVDGMDQDAKDLPEPKLPMGQATDNSFLLDWWVQFWDIFSAARGHPSKGTQYIGHARNLTQMQTDQRNQRMMMAAGGMGAAQYQNMIRQMPNGVAPNDLKRAAAMNNRNPNANPMANMNQMKNQGMMPTQMQRDGSQMDMNGQRPQSPSSNENAPSPNKRPRVEGAMNAGNMPGAQFNEFAQQQNVQQKQIEGMNPGVSGSPMNQPGLDGQHDLFAGNQPRPGMPAGAPGPPQGNHALQDYQMQLMLLEQQNRKRLLMARQEQDRMSGPHAQGAVGGPGGFPPSMSPQGSRAGPSPNPTDQMKKGTPRMGQQGLPGSPMPEGAMQQQRNSPAPGVFDPAQMPPGMPPQYGFQPGQMPQTPMMRPPSSHPNFNGQQLTPQQMEAMQRNPAAMQNGVWRQGQPGMMPNQQQMGPMGNNPQQRGQMPPPPAPTGEQPRTQEPSPSQPAQAPPTPSQGNKPNPKKKPTKDNKPANKAKGANTGATPAASGAEEPATPTPATPITPMHPKSFGQNGQQQPPQPPAQQQPPAAPQQQPPPMDNSGPPFGNITDETNFELGLGFDDSNALENFDFDSFLHVGDDSTGFGSLGADFGFESVEAGGDL